MDNKKEKFFWGVVNIGQQTEGHNKYSNWTKWDKRGLVPHIGYANNYWNIYAQYHNLVEEIGCNSMRITIEWSRIEPLEGEFDIEAVNHYRNILQNLHEKNITTVVGLWHWSVPMWFEQKYGMHSGDCKKKFIRFVKYICDKLGDEIDCVVVLNEPSVYISASYVQSIRPPFFKSRYRAICVMRNLIAIHKEVFKLWKEKYPQTQIGSTFLCNHEIGRDNSFIQNSYLRGKRFLQNGLMIRSVQRCSDYIGVNYYTSDSFYFGKSGGKIGIHGTNNWHNSNVWKKFPEGLYHVLMNMQKYKKPLMVLENGKPTNLGVNDIDRQEFLQESIKYMKKAIGEGSDVRGYFHYSLCDSYEWDGGYDFKFGLVEIDRKTGERIKRNSCGIYSQIIKKNN
ncbi:MAG: family 1 glycosylhydrolase [Candidatus Moraniibacteriota bacterium]